MVQQCNIERGKYLRTLNYRELIFAMTEIVTSWRSSESLENFDFRNNIEIFMVRLCLNDSTMQLRTLSNRKANLFDEKGCDS